MQTKTLTISPFKHYDMEDIISIVMDERVKSSDGSDYSEFSIRFTLEYGVTKLTKKFYNYTIKETAADKIVGICQLGLLDDVLDNNYYEISFHFHPDSWGKGYATETCKALVTHAFENLKASGVMAVKMRKDNNSVKVLEKNHFTSCEFFPKEKKVSYILNSDTYLRNKA